MIFRKVEAAGNDFILIDLTEKKSSAPSPRRIAQICDRHFGIGADGVILRQRSEKVRWKFFNNDGSVAAFCGNAARAFTLYLKTVKNHNRDIQFGTEIGVIRGKLVKSGPAPVLTVEVPIASHLEIEIPREIQQLVRTRLVKAKTAYLNSGVPHLVLGVRKLPGSADRNLISRLLYDHKATPRSKWNITWLETATGKAVTWERGVENETLSCGSGALACFMAQEKWSGPKVVAKTFKFPGGLLKVRRINTKSLSLTGQARIVFTGTLGKK